MSISNDFVHKVFGVAKEVAFIAIAIGIVSCDKVQLDNGKEDGFTMIGSALRIDMAGSDRIPGSVTIPEKPPVMTKLFVAYYLGDRQKIFGGDVDNNGSIKFGFHRIDQSKPVSLTKVAGRTDHYSVNNVDYVYFIGTSADTTAFKIESSSYVLGFENPASMDYLYKEPISGGHIVLRNLK